MGGRGKDIGEAAISFVLLKMLISVIYNGVAKITASTTRNIFKIMSKALVFFTFDLHVRIPPIFLDSWICKTEIAAITINRNTAIAEE